MSDARARVNSFRNTIEERRATAALLRALMEIDTRRLYLGESCASMFTYCTQVLHMAEGAAYNRIEAARAARSYPVILELFEQSAITLTAIRLLAPHLTEENYAMVLASARHKSKREIEELAVSLRPKPDAPVVVRKLPQAPPIVALLAASPRRPELPRTAAASVAAHATTVAPPPRSAEPAPAAPLSPDRYRIQLTVSHDTHEKFRRAQALIRHAVPSGDAAEIFDRALTLLIEDLERRRCAQTEQPRASKNSSKRSRYIPAAVRRLVWRRDGGRCAFVSAAGRCQETAFLDFHHVEPYGDGGAATAENIQLRCRAHNLYEARLYFADSVVRETGIPWGAVPRELVPERTKSEANRAEMQYGWPL